MCGVCVHMYTYSCLDATLHYTVCKHVHSVQMNITESTKGVTTTEGNEEECSHMDKVDIAAQVEEELPGIQCTKTMSMTLDLDQ